MKIFKIDTTSNENEWIVRLEDNAYEMMGNVSGSFNIIAARVLGFTYPDYLRYVRTKYNAVLKNKIGYSYAVFKNYNNCYDLVKELNKSWIIIEEAMREKLS